jgi:hypothetical protein
MTWRGFVFQAGSCRAQPLELEREHGPTFGLIAGFDAYLHRIGKSFYDGEAKAAAAFAVAARAAREDLEQVAVGHWQAWPVVANRDGHRIGGAPAFNGDRARYAAMLC